MRTLYAWLFAIGVALGTPFRLFRLWRWGEGRDRLAERMGSYGVRTKHAVTNRHVLWLYGSDRGAVNLCAHLIRALEPRVPNVKMVVSTETWAGMRELRRRLPDHVEKVYGPLDLRRWVGRAVAILHPDAVVLVESEVPPNLLRRLRDRGTPVFLIKPIPGHSPRLRHRLFEALFRPLMASVEGAGVAGEADGRQLVELGVRAEVIRTLGRLEFREASVDERRLVEIPVLLRRLGVPEGAAVLVAGGTVAGEEGVLVDVFLRLRERHSDLFLVLAPQQIERGREVGQVLDQRGIPFVYRREMTAATQRASRSVVCLLLNTPGEIKAFLAEATIVVLGRTFAGAGGQNPTDAAALGKPVVFGPDMGDFAEVSSQLVQAGAAVQVRDGAGLEAAVGQLLEDPTRREVLSRNARRTALAGTGALDQAAEMVVRGLARVEGMYTRSDASEMDIKASS